VNDAESFTAEAVESLNMLGVLASPGGYSKLVQQLGEAAAIERANKALRGCEHYAGVAARHASDSQHRAVMSSVEQKLKAAAEAWENGLICADELESVSRDVLESMGMPRRA
jgi:hypothetical protein